MCVHVGTLLSLGEQLAPLHWYTVGAYWPGGWQLALCPGAHDSRHHGKPSSPAVLWSCGPTRPVHTAPGCTPADSICQDLNLTIASPEGEAEYGQANDQPGPRDGNHIRTVNVVFETGSCLVTQATVYASM